MLGRLGHLLKATAQAREGAVAESVVGIVVAALNNKARDMFALILGLAMVDYAILNVYVSMRENMWLTRARMTAT